MATDRNVGTQIYPEVPERIFNCAEDDGERVAKLASKNPDFEFCNFTSLDFTSFEHDDGNIIYYADMLFRWGHDGMTSETTVTTDYYLDAELDGVFGSDDAEDIYEHLLYNIENGEYTEIIDDPKSREFPGVEASMKIKKTPIMAADEDLPGVIDDTDDEALSENIDELSDSVEDLQDQVEDVEEDEISIEMDNNITGHYIAECDRCHGIFISAVIKSDQKVEKVTGVCPLCDKESEQFLKWVIESANE